MVPLFLGLQIANLLMLGIVFVVGLTFGGGSAGLHAYHIGLGLAAGLLCLVAQVSTYMYFMATHKWLWAATDKAGFDPWRFVEPAMRNKSRSFPVTMAAVVMVMLAMFSGAAADASVRPWWPGEVHLAVSVAAIGVNLLALFGGLRLIRRQGRLMDQALAEINADSGGNAGNAPAA